MNGWGWALILLLAIALAGLGIWRWALHAQSVATLDRADALFTGSLAEVSAPIPYGPAPEQSVVVASPMAPGDSRPVVLFIHGGSWAKGSAPDYAFVARNMAARGFVGVSAGYRLVPRGAYPAMLEDGAAAAKWAVEHIADYGGDPERIYIMGHSAGAYNAVMLALDPQWLAKEGLPTDTIKGAIGLAGPYDFLPLDSDSTRTAFGAAPDLQATQPVNFAHPGAPPILLLSGDADTTVRPRNSQALAAALAAAGRPTEPVLFPGMSHSGILLALARPFEGDGKVKSAIFDFLERQEAKASAAIQGGER